MFLPVTAGIIHNSKTKICCCCWIFVTIVVLYSSSLVASFTTTKSGLFVKQQQQQQNQQGLNGMDMTMKIQQDDEEKKSTKEITDSSSVGGSSSHHHDLWIPTYETYGTADLSSSILMLPETKNDTATTTNTTNTTTNATTTTKEGGSSNNSHPQMAKDGLYVQAVQNAWKQQQQQQQQNNQQQEGVHDDSITLPASEVRPIHYVDPTDETPLYGYVLRRQQQQQQQQQPKLVPGILLFHTAAGPHDLFLLWKADTLITSLYGNTTSKEHSIHDEKDVVIMIVDLFSDSNGWGWDPNRTRYNQVRKQLLQYDYDPPSQSQSQQQPYTTQKQRSVLQNRIRAAIHAFQKEIPQLDTSRLSALGWCLGGYPILEFSRISSTQPSLPPQLEQQNDQQQKETTIPSSSVSFQMKALATFHGVFREEEDDNTTTTTNKNFHPQEEEQDDHHLPTNELDQSLCEVLICNGKLDPFVTEKDIEHAVQTFQQQHYNVRILQFDHAKHGFTNPAQDYNSNPAFAYEENAAKQAWEETLIMLNHQLFGKE